MMARWGLRCGPSLVAAAVFLVFALLWLDDRGLYLAVLRQYIWTAPGNIPFGDLSAVLHAGECWRHGVNVLVNNACMHGGMFNYSPVLLRINLLGVGPEAVLTGGVVMSLLFIAASALLPPVRTRLEFLLRCIVLCSCATAHGFEIGNIDLAMFTIAAVGLALQCGPFAGRLVGYGLFLFGGALKFYPAVLLVLIVRERGVRLLCLGAVLALGAGLVLWRYGHEMQGIFGGLPIGPPFRVSFGALNLPFGLLLFLFMPWPTVAPDTPMLHVALHHAGMPLYVILGARCLTVAALIAGLRLVPRYTQPLAVLDEARRIFLMGGAVLIAFCFYTAPNFEYRGIFLLLCLPGLYSLAMARHRSARLILVMIPLLMCERVMWTVFSGIGTLLPGHALAAWLGIALWLLREVCWWFIAVSFTAIGFAYLRMGLQALLPGAMQPGLSGAAR